MARVLHGTRFLILVPILGLALAAAVFFVFGGFGLIRLLVQLVAGALRGEGADSHLLLIDVVEYVHTFLVGTVLYITAVGLYQLFIEEVAFVGWLKIESTDELETSLIGVTVVVLAVNFMGELLAHGTEDLLNYGAGIALPIAALGLFVGLRAWSVRLAKGDGAAAGHEQGEA